MNPRALNGRLSEFVIGQAKAKRVLSVAVYNHFNRVRAILVPKLDQDLLPHPFNVFQPATSSSPPRKRSIPPVAALGSDIIRLTDQPLPGLLQSKGTESDLSAQPDWIQDQVTPLRRKRTNSPILDPDPTTYDQLEITPRKRTIKASATFQSEILTDFPGQSQAFPPLQSTTSSTSPIGSMRRPTINDPNDIQEKSNVLLIGHYHLFHLYTLPCTDRYHIQAPLDRARPFSHARWPNISMFPSLPAKQQVLPWQAVRRYRFIINIALLMTCLGLTNRRRRRRRILRATTARSRRLGRRSSCHRYHLHRRDR